MTDSGRSAGPYHWREENTCCKELSGAERTARLGGVLIQMSGPAQKMGSSALPAEVCLLGE